MATRQETAERTRALVTELRARIRRGDFPVGSRIPSLPELGRRHGLSKPTVLAALRPLVADGTLLVRTRVGMFVANPHPHGGGVHLILTCGEQLQASSVRSAFEERLDELGAQSLALSPTDFVERAAAGTLPPVLGVFLFTAAHAGDVLATIGAEVPVVAYDQADLPDRHRARLALLDLDNADAGHRAARELLAAGHRRIAYLDMAGVDRPSYGWSGQRADGCAGTVDRHQRRTPMVHLAARSVGPGSNRSPATTIAVRTRVATLAADRLDEFSACVGADDRMVAALTAELRARAVPESAWPVMVGFEGMQTAGPTHIASVVPGWSAMGARAGTLLFDHSIGRRPVAGRTELIPPEGVTPAVG